MKKPVITAAIGVLTKTEITQALADAFAYCRSADIADLFLWEAVA